MLCKWRSVGVKHTVRTVNPARHVLCERKTGLCKTDSNILLSQQQDGHFKVVACCLGTVRDIVFNGTEGAHLSTRAGQDRAR